MKTTTQTLFHQIPAPLLSWYRANKRDLAWRNDPTPYHVWVSEIMLQQTRVEAVKEYYARFISALPTVQDLATCEEEKLLKLWEGLGYYSRVRNMQKTAKTIVFDYDGVFPSELDKLRRLSGVGSYTAGAIASIAFGKRAAAVDGNVLRVITRLTQNPTDVSSQAYRKELEIALTEVYPQSQKDCSDFTQSLFELGALICKPKNPACAQCPLNHLCQANQNHTQLLYPVQPQKRAKREEEIYVFLIETPQGICIRRREQGVLKGMNEFPSCVSHGESIRNILNEWGMYEFTVKNTRKFTHIFTHIKWDITCVYLQTDGAPFDAYTLEEIEENISLPTAFKQCLTTVKEKQ